MSIPISQTSQKQQGFKHLIKTYPLITYFIIAFACTWLALLPLLLGRNGIGLFAYTLPDLVAFALAMFSALVGPTLAALTVTAIADGRDGVGRFLRRYVQWRVGMQWYLIVLFGYPLLYVAAASISLGTGAFSTLLQHWPLYLTVYLPHLLFINLIDAVAEEPGFRGFALTRLQLRFNPLWAALIVGGLHALWHLPVYFIPQMIGGAFSLNTLVTNSIGIMMLTIIWAWVFNNARGSILIAILMHAASNANSAFIHSLFPGYDQLPFAGLTTYVAFIVFALIITVLTRGRLSYKRNADPQSAPMSEA